MIAIFGGTFDPIHKGHLNMAKQCVEELSLDTLRFLPNATPVHKQGPSISAAHRLDMLYTAIADNPKFALDDRELRRTEPSYSVLTLQELRDEFPTQPIAFLMGMDSFNSLDKWFQWEKITQLCHVVVYRRPGDEYNPTPALETYLKNAEVLTPSALNAHPFGKCYFLTGTPFSAASSDIRAAIKAGENVEPWLSTNVLTYINKNELYTK
ncbi:nicotinate-nucleotide adenylyltransferase [Pseudoalteromonas sp. SMS1]|uniref:nicotinate-nucleotide adenylyltransferase n=1 Tax=Pseudoalteromonas sp. SMS1 TaxID=2908894 RepID=UPI001F2D2923|nr:nicotinate-nucleotide adenylyltransferase [Pseudoalteromonas sp. SMS1]MCF2857906.1 nicotinate-nucleotide adenylyltransferase [Pseudoalteromonas sp. SMS1]